MRWGFKEEEVIKAVISLLLIRLRGSLHDDDIVEILISGDQPGAVQQQSLGCWCDVTGKNRNNLVDSYHHLSLRWIDASFYLFIYKNRLATHNDDLLKRLLL